MENKLSFDESDINTLEGLKKSLKSAWKLQRDVPDKCRKTLEIILEKSSMLLQNIQNTCPAVDFDHAVNYSEIELLCSKCFFLLGKLYIEYYVDFETGIAYLCKATARNLNTKLENLSCDSNCIYDDSFHAHVDCTNNINETTSTVAQIPSKSEKHALSHCDMLRCDRNVYSNPLKVDELEYMGWCYHLSRAYYYNNNYTKSWEVIRNTLSKVQSTDSFPCECLEPIWGGVKEECQHGDCSNSVTSSSSGYERIEIDRLIIIEKWDRVNKYHYAMVLHALVLSVLHCPRHAYTIAEFVNLWLPSHREEMWRQFNAETRFATLVLKLIKCHSYPLPLVSICDDTIYRVTHCDPWGVVTPHRLSVSDNINVYTLGESHTLPTCWHKIQVDYPLRSKSELDAAPEYVKRVSPSAASCIIDTQDTVDPTANNIPTFSFIPRLVIGLKAWHFNPALKHSRERGILWAHMGSIPEGSVVMVCAGEIDLRSGGAIACDIEAGIGSNTTPIQNHKSTVAAKSKSNSKLKQKAPKYNTHGAAIGATVDAYFSGLREMKCVKKLRLILVQPVRPVPPSQDLIGQNVPSIIDHHIEEWNDAVENECNNPENEGILFMSGLFQNLCKESPSMGVPCGTDDQPGRINQLNGVYDIGDGVHLNREPIKLFAECVWKILKSNIFNHI